MAAMAGGADAEVAQQEQEQQQQQGAESAQLVVRRAEPSDLETLVKFNVEIAWVTEQRKLDPDVVRSGVGRVLDASSGKGMYVVAEKAGEVVGSLLVTLEWSDWSNSDYYWVQSVFVSPSARRQGVFTSLYAKVRELALAAGSSAIRLYVEHDNDRAKRTYEKVGMNQSHYHMFEEDLTAQAPPAASS